MHEQMSQLFSSYLIARTILWLSFDLVPPFIFNSWNQHFCPLPCYKIIEVKTSCFCVTMSSRDPGYGWFIGPCINVLSSCALCVPAYLQTVLPSVCPGFTVNPGINCTNHHSTIFSIKTWMTFVLVMTQKSHISSSYDPIRSLMVVVLSWNRNSVLWAHGNSKESFSFVSLLLVKTLALKIMSKLCKHTASREDSVDFDLASRHCSIRGRHVKQKINFKATQKEES